MDWSVIWHNFDVIECSSRGEDRERVERKRDNRICRRQRILKRFSQGKSNIRKRHLPDTVGPKTRRRSCPPRKEKVLETQQRVVVGAIKASPAVKKKLVVEEKTELSAQRKIQPRSAETKRNAILMRNERIARLEVKVALETLEKEDGAVRPEKRQPCFVETKRLVLLKTSVSRTQSPYFLGC